MLFLRLKNKKLINSTAHSLRAYPDKSQDNRTFLSFLVQRIWIVLRPLKRASLFAPRYGRKASMTLEAAFALPFFLFAIINIIFSMNIIAAQSRVSAALHQTGNKMAFGAYVYDNTIGSVFPEGLSGVVLSEGYARSQIADYIGCNYLKKSCIVGGGGGLSLVGSSIMGAGDTIDLCISYRVKPFTELMGFRGFVMSQRYFGKAWTGYDVEQSVSDLQEQDPMVYVTETGTVYHLARSCTYLNPSVEAVPAVELAGKRNSSGGKYYVCERCGGGQLPATVYITSQGSSYHRDLNCSGLKRTIYTIPLSQTGGRRRCSKCG